MAGVGRRQVLIGEYFPLLIHVQPVEYSRETVAAMAADFEVYFDRGDRYFVVTVPPKGAIKPGAKERGLVADWVNSPRVAEYGRRLCIGSASVLESGFERGLLTALLWAWRPPFPLEVFGTVEAALDHAVARLRAESLSLPYSRTELHQLVSQRLASVM